MEAKRPHEAAFTEDDVEADGFSFHYLEGGEGDPVVILDGIKQGLSELQDTLAKTYHVVVLDLQAVGESQPNAGLRSAEELAKAITRVVAQAAQGPYTLIGTSFGANVALWHALRYPDKVEALVLVSPTAILPTNAPNMRTPEESSNLLFAHPEDARRPHSVVGETVATEQALLRRLEGAVHDEEAQRRLHEIQCPTLVLFGSKDRIVSTGAARIYRENISNCNVSIVYDAGHMIGLERPDAFVNVVSDYVERRDSFVVNRQSSLINP